MIKSYTSRQKYAKCKNLLRAIEERVLVRWSDSRKFLMRLNVQRSSLCGGAAASRSPTTVAPLEEDHHKLDRDTRDFLRVVDDGCRLDWYTDCSVSHHRRCTHKTMKSPCNTMASTLIVKTTRTSLRRKVCMFYIPQFEGKSRQAPHPSRSGCPPVRTQSLRPSPQ